MLAWRLARRELRSGLGGFVVFLACLALGVAAIAAVGVLNAGIVAGLQRDSVILVGGDVELESVNLPIPAADLAILLPEATARSEVVRTNALVRAGGQQVAVALKAIDDAYPLYGALELTPGDLSPEAALRDGGALAEPALLSRLGIGVGDEIQLGAATFTIRGVIQREPDRLEGGLTSLGPRVMIQRDQLPATKIVLPGSLVRYDYRFALPPGSDPEATIDRLRAANPDAAWQASGARDLEPRVTRVIDRLASYLTVAGLTSLLIGGIGVALAIRTYLAGKTATIATLKCLGASSRLVFAVYLLQVLVLAGLGIAIGLAVGQAVPYLLRSATEGVLPVRIVTGFFPLPLALAAGCGLLTALCFAIWPLARARGISAAAMFRAALEAPARWPSWPVLLLLAASLLALAGLALAGVADRKLGGIFIGVALGAALALGLVARALLLLLARIGRVGGLRMRLALANLRRPGAQAAGVVVALGAGLAVLTVVTLIGRNLSDEVAIDLGQRVPAMFFIDIQPDQRPSFAQAARSVAGATVLQEAPIVRGRVVRIKGVPTDQTGIQHWTLRQDRGLSYAAAMPAGTRLVAGKWWPADYQGPPLVSVEDEVGEAYGVKVGDRLSFNILGRVVEAEIANLRAEIDWSEGRLDFVFLFSPGLISAAPHSFAAAVDVPEAAEPQLLTAVASALPNVTPISIRAVTARINEVMDKVRLAVLAVAGVTLTSGLLVLAGAVAAARRRHLYEAVVLKVLGARRADLLQLFSIEYLCLGLAAALTGAVLGTLGAYVIVTQAMDLTWRFAWLAVLLIVLMSLALTLVAGFAGTWRLLGRPAAPVLRAP